MKPRSSLFAISIGIILALGCSNKMPTDNCASRIDSVSTLLDTKLDTFAFEIQELSAALVAKERDLSLLRDSIRAAEEERIRILNLPRSSNKEPPIPITTGNKK
jgi:outer membrane murein-binding lipoprotein Lpp